MSNALPYIIGERADRIDGLDKVTGISLYTDDIPCADALHAVFVSAGVAKGEVVAIDVTAAVASPGVVAVYTCLDAPRLAAVDHLALLQDNRVRHRGQPIALVVATDRNLAFCAARLVVAEYQANPGLAGRDAILGASVLAAPLRRSASQTARGDPEAALATAAVTVSARYSTPTHNHNPMETHAALIEWTGNRVTVHTSTQTLAMTRAAIATAMAIPESDVRVLCEQVGGGFGSKGGGWRPVLTIVAAVSRRIGRPLRIALSRAEMFTLVGRRQGTVHDVRLGADADGMLTALVHEATAQTSSFADYTDPNATLGRVIYACANVRTSHRLVATDEPTPVPMRAPGEGPGSFALESAMDELAEALAMDPLELRRRNFASRDQHLDRPWSSNGLLRCYDMAATSFGWGGGPPPPRSMRRGGVLRGWGMASALYPTYWAAAAASIEISPHGVLEIACGTQEIGTGNATIIAQIASDILHWPRDRLRVIWGDTDLPVGPASVGSLGAASVAPAIVDAAKRMRDLLSAHGMSPRYREDIGEMVTRAAPGVFRVEANRTEEPPASVSTYAWGAVFADVSVDAATAEVRVRRLHAAYAAGRILNRQTAMAQYRGGLTFGIGMACHEETVTDPRDGLILNADLGEYLIPVAADMPEMQVHIVDEEDPVAERFGVKGVGMLGTVGTAAAIANAVYNATGCRVRELPIRIETILPCL